MSKYSPILATAEWLIGEDKILAFTITDAAGAPKSMTGKTLEFVLRKDADGDVLFTKSGAAITFSNSGAPAIVDDVVNVAISRATTIDAQGVILIQPGIYYYTLRQTDTGDAEALAFGPAVLRLGATR